LTACDKVFPGDHEIWGCFKGEELIGGCPLRIYRDGIFRKSTSFLWRTITPYNGVVIKSLPKETKVRRAESINRSIIQSLSDAFEKEGISYIKLMNSPAFIDVRPFVWCGWRNEVIYTYYLMPHKPVQVEHFSRVVRRSVKKAARLGMTLERSENINEYFDLYLKVLFRHHSSWLPYRKMVCRFLRIIVPLLYNEKKCEMWLLRTLSGDVASGEIVLFDNKRTYFWSAVNNPDFFDTGAPYYLKFRLIEEYSENHREIDMIEADTPSIAHFKAGFNPRIVPHYAVEKSSTIYRAFSTLYNVCYWNLYSSLAKKRSPDSSETKD